MSLSKNVYFVGFMGAGKSTVARKLARSGGFASLDLDKYIERKAGKSIPQIFSEGGETLFRDLEAEMLEELSGKSDHMLISCGGGIIERKENRELLKRPENAVIHLLLDADQAAERISDISSRPLFQNPEQARELFERRLPLYEEVADHTILSGGKNVWEVTDEATEFLRKEGILCQ